MILFLCPPVPAGNAFVVHSIYTIIVYIKIYSDILYYICYVQCVYIKL